jgi:peptidoglycan/LPS O-acetylase OafA/YrhL
MFYSIAYGLIIHKKPRQLLPFWTIPAILFIAWCSYALLGVWSQTIGAYPVCIAVGLCIPFARESTSKYLNTTCNTIAKYSYGIYLVHAPALAISFSLELPVVAKLFIFAGTTVILSVLSYRFIEVPLIRKGKNLTRVRTVRPEIAATT